MGESVRQRSSNMSGLLRPINRAPWSASTAPVYKFILEFFAEPRQEKRRIFSSVRIEEKEEKKEKKKYRSNYISMHQSCLANVLLPKPVDIEFEEECQLPCRMPCGCQKP